MCDTLDEWVEEVSSSRLPQALKIELENHRFTLDVLTASNVPFGNTSVTSVARLDMFHTGATPAYFDEIVVR